MSKRYLKMLIAIAAMADVNAANAARCQVSPEYQLELKWVYAPDVAIKLPEGTSEYYRQSAYETRDFWDTPDGRVEASYNVAPVSWWANDSKEICRMVIDGYSAVVYEWKRNGKSEAGALFKRAPIGPDFLVLVPVDSKSPSGKQRALSELLSIRFINDPKKITLLEIDYGKESARAIFSNEIDRRIEVSVGDVVTAKMGWVHEIRSDSVVIKEPAGDDYVFITYGITKKPSD
jgi:hypothetical protein